MCCVVSYSPHIVRYQIHIESILAYVLDLLLLNSLIMTLKRSKEKFSFDSEWRWYVGCGEQFRAAILYEY
jgi:hypothetical protein